MAGGRLLAVPQPASDDFRLSPASLDAALAAHPGAAAAILITNPHNPTGHLIGADTLAELGAICERHDVTLIADEVYGALVYGDNPQARLFRSCTAVPGLCQRAICLGSFSKVAPPFLATPGRPLAMLRLRPLCSRGLAGAPFPAAPSWACLQGANAGTRGFRRLPRCAV